jgi:hypothetical protein
MLAAPCAAQRVWVGGGVHVRAPFVRVDVGPYGGVSVRAPFTAIDVPGRMYYKPYYDSYPVVIEERIVEPAFPTAAELAAMDDARLYEQLRLIGERLRRRLSRFNTGETWQEYLRLPEEAMASSPEERRGALVKLSERFQRLAGDQQYSMISRLPAFVAMEAALSQTLARADGSPAATETPPQTEELPLPSPDRPVPPQRDGPFLRPK